MVLGHVCSLQVTITQFSALFELVKKEKEERHHQKKKNQYISFIRGTIQTLHRSDYLLHSKYVILTYLAFDKTMASN